MLDREGYTSPDASREREKNEQQFFVLGQETPVIRSNGEVDPGWKVFGAELGEDGKIFYSLRKDNLKKFAVSQAELFDARQRVANATQTEARDNQERRDVWAKDLIRNRLAAGVSDLDRMVKEMNLALSSLNKGEDKRQAVMLKNLETFQVRVGEKEFSLVLGRSSMGNFERYWLRVEE